MKNSITYEKHDESSTEKKELVMFGETFGYYTYGIYCRYQKFLAETRNDIIANIGIYVKKALVDTFKIPINSIDKLRQVQELMEEKTIGEWFDNYMKREMQ